MIESKNVFGETLKTCSTEPLTGYFRDGCCNTGKNDRGLHTVCAIVTDVFLDFSKARGNDLSTPLPQYSFPGLKEGDRWCLCSLRWKEAYENGVAPKVVLESTHEKTLEHIPMEWLLECAYKS